MHKLKAGSMANLVEPGLVRARLLKLVLGSGLKKIGLIPPMVCAFVEQWSGFALAGTRAMEKNKGPFG